MPEKVRLQGLTAKIEVTYGTDPVPTPAADAIQVEEILWQDIDTDFLHENVRENLATGFLGEGLAGARSGRFCKFRVPVVVKGAGVAYSATVKPEMDVILRACAMKAVVDVTVSLEKWTYTRRSLAHESCTIYVYSSGRRFKVVGCRGNLAEMAIAPGLITNMMFDMSGILVADPNDETVPAFTYPNLTVLPPATLAAGLTLNAFDPDDFRTFVFNQGAIVEERPGGNATNGHAGYEINGFNTRVTTVIDSPPLASFNPYTLEAAATKFVGDIDMGSVQYNKLTLNLPQLQILKTAHQADRSFGMVALTMKASDTATGDDAFDLVFD